MPYIKQERRKVFEESIQRIVYCLGMGGPTTKNTVNDGVSVITYTTKLDEDAAKGELNYVIFSIIQRYIKEHGIKYSRCQDFIGGVLTCCQHELIRRILSPYEDECIKKNGDVLTAPEPPMSPGEEPLVVLRRLASKIGERTSENETKPWSSSAIMCNHANECPVNCTCDEDCYCKVEGCCRPKGKF